MSLTPRPLPYAALLLVVDQRIVVRFAVGVGALVSDSEHLAVCRHDPVHTADHFAAHLEREVAGVRVDYLAGAAVGVGITGYRMVLAVIREGHMHGHFIAVGADQLLIEGSAVGALCIHARPALRRGATELRFCDIELPCAVDGICRERGGAEEQRAEQSDRHNSYHSPSPVNVLFLLSGQPAPGWTGRALQNMRAPASRLQALDRPRSEHESGSDRGAAACA